MTPRNLNELIRLANEGAFTAADFDDVLMGQLGKLGQIALDLEAIAAINPGKAKELAQSLDAAQGANDAEQFNRLVLQVETLAEAARNL